METEKTKNIVVYDENQDTIFISKSRKTYASIDIDDFIFDFDKQGFLVAVEIENVSKNLGIGEEKLHNVDSVTLTTTYKPNLIKIVMFFKFKNLEKEVIVPLYADLGHKKITTKSFAAVPN